jgi:excisionase family DNA binding protein
MVQEDSIVTLAEMLIRRGTVARELAELDHQILSAAVQPVAPPVADDDRLLDVPTVAGRLELKSSYIYELARRRGIPSIRVGKFIRIRESVVREIETGKRCIDA